MELRESGEDYLEAILALHRESGTVRSVDVAQHLGVSKPSVSRAMGVLRGNGYLTMDDENLITLTEAGLAVATQIDERHRLLSQWLTALGVSPDVAAADACRMEHDMSEETFARLKAHILGGTT
ncbi:MAG: metal-dependent transcriptional regulator [Oscillospiraceae bacterium]